MSQAELLAALTPAQKKHVDPASPMPMRMMAARGLAPLPPKDLVPVLCGLSLDGDATLAQAAKQTIAGLPEKVLAPVLEGEVPGIVLGRLATLLAGVPTPNEGVLEKLVVNRYTPDEGIAALAPVASAKIAEIIAENQERGLRSRAVVDAIRKNPNVLRSSLDRLFDFLVRQGQFYDGMPEIAEAVARLTPAEVEQAVGDVELPPEAQALVEETQESEARAEAVAQTLDGEEEEAEKERRIPILKVIASLNMAQKVSLAIKGNKEARAILVRDRNRVVASAAIRNPRITENEVVSAAQSRSVCEEVVRIISRDKQMTRSYAVKLALAGNPKTPLPSAMTLLPLLRANDLRDLAKSKNIPTGVSTQARRLISRQK